jgi:serine phosphatase RsbU (regulator of sigma subunit)
MHALFDFAKSNHRPRNPVQAPVPDLRDAQLAAVYYDHRIGGDCYDFLRVGSNRLLFVLLDIAGRAADNREIVSSAQAAFRSAGAELFAQEDVNEANAMVDLFLELNRNILQTAERVCSSPAFAGCYNESLGTVSYFNAGHTPGLLLDRTGIVELPATGLPLGLFSHATPDASIIALEPGSALVLVSRGVVEARNKTKELGLRKVKEKLERLQTRTAQEICTTVLGQVRDFARKPPTDNDVTVLALVRNSPAAMIRS